MDKLLGIFLYVRSRLKEPSSLSAISAVLLTFNVHLNTVDVNNWLTTLSIVFGALGFVVKESGPLTKV